MATDHTSTDHEQFEKMVEEEANGQETTSLPNESVEKHDKADDAQDQATPSSKTDGGAEAYEREFEDAEKQSLETHIYKARPTETEKAESVVTETVENPSGPEKQSLEKEDKEQQKTVIHQTESVSAKKPGNTVEVRALQESGIKAIKETGDTNLEAAPGNKGKPEVVKCKETSNEIIKEPISLKEEKTNKVEETSILGNSAQVSLNEEAQAVTENPVESSPAAAKEVAQEACTDDIGGVSKEVDGVLKDPEDASIIQEAKTEVKEEKESSAPISVEEKVAANEEKKQAEAPEESSIEAAMKIKKDEEQNKMTMAATEEGDEKTENVTNEKAAVDNEKQGEPEIKVDQGATTVSEQIRETLASKLEENEHESVETGVDNMEKAKTEVQTPEPDIKERDATKTSKDVPKETSAKPAQKQSNNILSKVKHSLVKAKKAIIGKSATSKTVSTDAEGGVKSNNGMR